MSGSILMIPGPVSPVTRRTGIELAWHGNRISVSKELSEVIVLPARKFELPRKEVLVLSLRMTLRAMWRKTARVCGAVSKRFLA